jgi:hypothetical protein
VNLHIPLDDVTLGHLKRRAAPTGQKAEIQWIVKVQARDKLHEFPIPIGEPHGGEPYEGPKVDDL